MRVRRRARARHARRGARCATSLQRAIALGAPVIGVNARDLSTFAIDRRSPARARASRAARPHRDRGERSPYARPGRRRRARGRDAVLVGTSLMQAADPGAKLRELLSRPLVKVCGLTRQEDVDAAVEAGADLRRLHPRREEPAPRAGRARCAGRRRSPSPSSSARRTRPAPISCSSTPTTAARSAAAGADHARGRARSRPCSTNRGRGRSRALEHARRHGGPDRARRRSRPRERRATRSRLCTPGPSTPRRRSRASRESRTTRACARSSRRHEHEDDNTFGTYGGRYVPETLIPALDELERGWRDALADDSFHAELHALADDVRGAPDTAHARRALRARQAHLPEARRPPPHRRAQAQQRARPDRARAAARQAPHRRRDGRRASTASRPRRSARSSASSASSTWARKTFAGRSPTSSAWACSAPRSAPSTSGRRR